MYVTLRFRAFFLKILFMLWISFSVTFFYCCGDMVVEVDVGMVLVFVYIACRAVPKVLTELNLEYLASLQPQTRPYSSHQSTFCI
jgi:hypothetical protein